MMRKPGRLDFAERAREKQRARDADAAALASGEKSAAQIDAETNMFAGLPPGVLRNAKVHFPEKK